LAFVFIVPTAFIFSQLVADFASGFVHWAGDTWGTIQTPFLGKSVILFFREHHVDPIHMTYRNFFVSNSKPFMIILPMQLHLYFTPIESLPMFWYLWVWLFLTVSAGLSNQLHSYAHQPKCNAFIRFLQNWGIIINMKRHKVHHDNLDLGYCISNGWLNPILDSCGFWRKLESVITAITGLQPQTFVPLEQTF
jgi:ubiquitin-conjugating enzyme E2 variant